MAKVEHTSDARVLVGIDISKHRHEVLIAVPGKTRRRRLTITNCTEDFVRLIAILQEYGLPVRIGFEATGNYHRVLMYHLGVAGFDLKLVSSVALARTREALHNSWDKNDPKDAQVILHMLQIGAVQIFQDPMVAGTNDIQELSKTWASSGIWVLKVCASSKSIHARQDGLHRPLGDWPRLTAWTRGCWPGWASFLSCPLRPQKAKMFMISESC